MAAIAQLKIKLDETKKNWFRINTEKGTYAYNPKEFGRGSYGNVHEAVDKNKKTVAAKVIGKGNPKLAQLESDVVELLKLDHPNVVHMFDRLITPDKIWIFMEYCPFGNLNKYLRARKLSVEEFIQQIFIPCAEGLTYLHGQNVIHRDIKPGNILVGEEGCVKLADYDLSQVLGEIYDTSSMSSFVGAQMFWAPEIHQQKPYKRSVDIFALGLTFLATAQNNWVKGTFGDFKLVPKIEDKNLKDYQRTVPIGSLLAGREDLTVVYAEKNPVLIEVTSKVKWIISQMTRVKPEDRLTAAEVLQKLQQPVKPLKLVKSGTWSDMKGHSMCVNRRDELMVCTGNVLRVYTENSASDNHVRVYNRQDGSFLKEIPSHCKDSWCRIMEHPTDPDYVLQACGKGVKSADNSDDEDVVFAINLDTGEQKIICKFLASNGKTEPCAKIQLKSACKGPAGSMLALVSVKTTHTSSCRVMQLEWRSETEEFRAAQELKFDTFHGRSMCYAESSDILVIASLRKFETDSHRIFGVRLRDGSRVWELSGAVAGKDIDPWGLCYDSDGRVYVCDSQNSRILQLDGESGAVLQVLLEGEGMFCFDNICWSDVPPQLTVQHYRKVTSFNVTKQ